MLKSVYRFFSSKYKTLHADYAVDFVPRYGHGLPPHKELYAIINENRTSYKSFIENALAKARHASKLTGLPALAGAFSLLAINPISPSIGNPLPPSRPTETPNETNRF